MNAKSAFLPALVYESPAINKYLNSMKNMKPNTWKTAKSSLSLLPGFTKETYKVSIDKLIADIKAGKQDRYDVLADYVTYARKLGKSNNTIRKVVKAARIFFETQSIEFSDRQLKYRVPLPRKTRKERKPLNQAFITKLIQSCPDASLRLCLLWHAATGRRPEELFSLRHCDIDLKRKFFLIRADFTKMATEQERPMTDELTKETEDYLKYKQRKRTAIVGYEKDGTPIKQAIIPKLRPEEYLFSTFHSDEKKAVAVKWQSLYENYVNKFQDLVDRLGMGKRVGNNPKSRREIVLYSFRDFAKTTISNAGYYDFAEWYMGHSHSKYWNTPEEEKLEIFRKIEDRITFLDTKAIETRRANLEGQLDQQKANNKALQEQLTKMQLESDRRFLTLVRVIQDNPKLGKLKPEVLKELNIEDDPTV